MNGALKERFCLGERTFLFQEMAEAAGVPCAALLGSHLREGAPAFGRAPAPGLRPKSHHPAEKS